VGEISICVAYDDATVEVRVAGVLDDVEAARLRHILEYLTLEQGFLYVRVDFDVLAEAAVLAVLGRISHDGGAVATGALAQACRPPPW
jgi:hypothetical protein